MGKTKKIFQLALIVVILLTTITTYADDKDKDKDKDKAAATANANTKVTPKSKLDDKENPQLVGKRDINKHQPNFYSLAKEIGLGQQLSGEVERQLKFIDDPIVTEYVNRIGQNIVLNSDAKVPFTIKVVDSEEINAFALPGGFFYVNKGLILAADSEAEIVGVMAHEIAHVAARHGTEQATKGQVANIGSIGLIFIGGPIGLAARSVVNLAVPLTFLKFSRGSEAEADLLGAEYAWASGYDPMGMVAMFEKLAQKETHKPGSVAKVFSDHPATGDRANNVRALITKFPDRDEYIVNTSEFNQVKARLLAVSGGSRSNGGLNSPGTDGRPTLKRRPDAGSTGDVDNGQPPQAPRDRPTLKRRDNDPNYQNQTDPQEPPVAPNRPTLKRSGSTDNPSDSPSDSSSSSSDSSDNNN